MIEQVDLDFVQKTLVDVATANGVELEELKNGWDEEKGTNAWSVNYERSLKENVEDQLRKLKYACDLYYDAMAQNDKVAAKSSLMDLRLAAMTLYCFFHNIFEDCEKIMGDDPRFIWPDFPEDYKLPAHYNYKGPK